MNRLPYWKIWICIILGLGCIRLITSAPDVRPTPASVSISESKPVTHMQASDFAAPAHIPQTGTKKKASEPLPVHSGVNTKPTSNGVNRKAEFTSGVPLQTESVVSAEAGSGTSSSKIIDRSFFAMHSPTMPDSVSPKAPEPDVSSGYFTIGSTKADVLRVQGSPTRYNEYQWNYNLSRVEFRNDRVVSWTELYGSPLKVKMIPSAAAVSNAKGYFTVGSTKDEVLAVQGTPTQVEEYRWNYNLSRVEFRNDRVVSWTELYGSPLKVKMIPSAAAVSNAKGYFTVGSTKDEVLAVQGTPTQVEEYRWNYNLSRVEFRNDRVVSWTELYGSPLKVKMIPSAAAVSNAKGYFTVGSTKDEVLAVQGTPTQVEEYRWTYGLSRVEFRNDLVVSWTELYGSPLKAKKE